MNGFLMRLLDAGFGHPRGVLGRLGGALMAYGNSEQERWAVEQARLVPEQRVLVVGHGPGLGLRLAAAAVSPGGLVVGVDPSSVMRQMATARCASAVTAGVVELREGTAEDTGCADASVDAVISVNNVMLWDRGAGFDELVRVLRPGGRMVVTVHRPVLDVAPETLAQEASEASLVDVTVVAQRRQHGLKVELLARRAP
ncbi:MAG: methyltransferase domain-containing protein [Actinomycetota bacterium]|nr:methyltransferase domain-containing protein [Actinomycetota bacterium]